MRTRHKVWRGGVVEVFRRPDDVRPGYRHFLRTLLRLDRVAHRVAYEVYSFETALQQQSFRGPEWSGQVIQHSQNFSNAVRVGLLQCGDRRRGRREELWRS